MRNDNGQKGENQSPPASSNDSDDSKRNECPCGEVNESSWIHCDTCNQWLHCNCVGLKGLNSQAIKSLKEWECPRCLASPYLHGLSSSDDVVTKADLAAVCSVLKDSMKKDLSAAVVTLKDTVVTSVIEKTKSYAAVAAENQKTLVAEVKSAATSAELVDKICQKMDSDNYQRERKKSNILVSNVPEPTSTLSAQEKKEADIVYMCKNFGMERNEILTCFRTGAIKKDDNGNPLPRPIVAKMLDVETAEHWHNSGKGYKIGESWINPDLCKVDRDNQFFARQERRRRKKEESVKKLTPKS